jgi:hypothetical protein
MGLGKQIGRTSQGLRQRQSQLGLRDRYVENGAACADGDRYLGVRHRMRGDVRREQGKQRAEQRLPERRRYKLPP